jgi:uncharacterized secreted repeat protein (TIGR03808 family)
MNRRTLIGAVAAVPLLRTTAMAEMLQPRSGDQTAEVQAAIKQALSGNRHLQLGPGTFEVGMLRVQSDITITGIPGRTFLKFRGGKRLMSISSADTVVLQGLSFLSEGVEGELVLAEAVERLLIEDCDFSAASTGVRTIACAGRITGSRFRNQKDVAVQALDSKGLEISGNTVTDQSNNGIQIFRSEKGDNVNTVSNNFIARIAAENGDDGPYGNGINVYNSRGTIVANNRITECAFTGIRNNSSDDSTITGNQITKCKETALYVEFTFEGAVVSNNIVDTAASGISIVNFRENGRLAQCTGNIIRNIAGKDAHGDPLGGAITAEADAVVANNVIESIEAFGIQLGWGPYGRNLTATGNMLRACGRGIIFSAVAPGPMLIANNLIVGSKTGAIFGMDHYDPVTPDLMVDASAVPAHVTLSGNSAKS